MSNPISEARADVAAVLETIPGLIVHQFIPEQLEAPAATITSGEPYLAPGKAQGESAVTLSIRIFVDGDNQMQTETIDQLLWEATEALRAEFGYAQASGVGIDSESYSQVYLVSDITMNAINYKGGA